MWFTRVSNDSSKKFANYAHMAAIYTIWHNFVKMHEKHLMSPAIVAGVSDRFGAWKTWRSWSRPQRPRRGTSLALTIRQIPLAWRNDGKQKASCGS